MLLDSTVHKVFSDIVDVGSLYINSKPTIIDEKATADCNLNKSHSNPIFEHHINILRRINVTNCRRSQFFEFSSVYLVNDEEINTATMIFLNLTILQNIVLLENNEISYLKTERIHKIGNAPDQGPGSRPLVHDKYTFL
ncbi:hypothetical protein CAEBREN_11683 [Caenorhabditis brenneri]|uniref:Uncharacterized protein n=1 Tax=Caenorhabditis brenneri TaxID=135651 RepID=G0P4J6_CAEBE|nr:hypothetical protein CAEBREN_11683 [Caenorhabditis brenneri]